MNAEEIKKKAKLNIAEMFSTSPPQHVDTSAPQKVNTVKGKYPKKLTVYVTEEIATNLNNLYARRILNGKKSDKSDIICEALNLLFGKERE